MRSVTPLLAVDANNNPVEPLEAYVDIKLRRPTVVSDDDAARETLGLLGLTEAEIEDRIAFSHTGRVTTV